MNRRKHDAATLDVYHGYAPKPVVAQFDPERVKAISISALIKRAVAETMRECHHSREAIAQLMSEQLGESVTPAMLDQYTSTANDKHNIPAHRLMALFDVTQDVRLLNALLADRAAIVVDARFEPLIRRELAKEARDRLDQDISNADAQWRAAR